MTFEEVKQHGAPMVDREESFVANSAFLSRQEQLTEEERKNLGAALVAYERARRQQLPAQREIPAVDFSKLLMGCFLILIGIFVSQASITANILFEEEIFLWLTGLVLVIPEVIRLIAGVFRR